MSILFEPITIGTLKLKNRIIMAPLTRCRAGDIRVPNELMAEYYAQRASAGLIISEATSISPMGVGYAGTPGIWNQEQIEGWKLVTKKVHANNGKIFLQLWHVGRISDPYFLDGKTPVAPSSIPADGYVHLVRPKHTFVVPRALEIAEIKDIIADYTQAAINAKEAGFDGVEIHGANGYLLDQFLQDNSNKRTDIYGGPIENRARLLLEVTDSVIQIWGASRVGVHIAPRCDDYSMGDSDPLSTFTYVAKELGKRKIAFLFARATEGNDNLNKKLKSSFGGNYIINQNLSKEDAERLIKDHHGDAAAFGKTFIANPDLVERFKLNSELNTPHPELFHASSSEGYTDYPTL